MTGYRPVVTLVVPWLAVSVASAACSNRSAWEHQTLAGLQADEKFQADDRHCESSVPDVLPPGVFQNAQYAYIYESYDGPKPGLGETEAAHRARRLRIPTDDGLTRSAAEPKTDLSRRAYGDQHRRYKRCMLGRGWREKPLLGGDGSRNRGESPQPTPR